MDVKLKRIYEDASNEDGFRVLVDRLWPRGIKKEDARVDEWLKDVAPSTELRKWFNHDPEKWEEFKTKYHKELNNSAALDELMTVMHEHKAVTLLYAAKDEAHNHALVLMGLIKKHPVK